MISTNNPVYKDALVNKKYADIEGLTNAVAVAQYEVDELNSIVTSLTAKQTQFSALLSKAESDKNTALSNYNQVKVVANKVATLRQYSSSIAAQMASALQTDDETPNVYCKVNSTAKTMSVLIEKLIFSVDVIEKLSGFVNRQKAANPVIPDELVSILGQATSDSNNAVSLTLKAMQSAYSSVYYADDVSSVSGLEMQQAEKLNEILGNEQQDKKNPSSNTLFSQIHIMYDVACDSYDHALTASAMATSQLEHAQSNLATATTALTALKAGLEAAKAAAFAA